jgi:hypothetical protein
MRTLEDMVATKYLRHHHRKLQKICVALMEEEPTESLIVNGKPVETKISTCFYFYYIYLLNIFAETPLLRPYFHAVLQHMMIVHMETLTLRKEFRRRVIHELLTVVLDSIHHSPTYPSRQGDIECALLLRVVNGKDGNNNTVSAETTTDSSNTDNTTEFGTASSLSHSAASLPDTTSSALQLSSTDLSHKEPKPKYIFNKSKSTSKPKPEIKSTAKKSTEVKPNKNTRSQQKFVPGKFRPAYPLAATLSPNARLPTLKVTRSILISRHRFASVATTNIQPLPISTHSYKPPTFSSYVEFGELQEDIDKALASVCMTVECLDSNW